jgi:hypothetical protein
VNERQNVWFFRYDRPGAQRSDLYPATSSAEMIMFWRSPLTIRSGWLQFYDCYVNVEFSEREMNGSLAHSGSLSLEYSSGASIVQRLVRTNRCFTWVSLHSPNEDRSIAVFFLATAAWGEESPPSQAAKRP